MKRRRYFSSDSDDESQGDASEERAVVMGSDYESQGDGSEERAVLLMGSNTAAGPTNPAQTEPHQQRRSDKRYNRVHDSQSDDDDDFVRSKKAKRKKFKSGSDVEMHDEAFITDEPRPIRSNADRALLINEVMQYLKNANTKYRKYLSTTPAVQPQGGMLFLFDLGPDKEKWNLMRRKLRCDQYRWVHKGTHSMCDDEIKKKSGMIDCEHLNRKIGDPAFRREEYWGVGPYFLIHYYGDHTVFKGFKHRNSKSNTNQFVTTAPHVKKKILNADILKPPQRVYQELVNEDTGGPRHQIHVPRNTDQVRNFRKEVARNVRLTHDAIYNTYQLCYQLMMNNRKGDPVDFIRHFSIHPTVIAHMIPQSLIEALDVTIRISSQPLILHYDTVFNMGDFYLSTLLFRHQMFKGNPIIPLGFIIHSRRFHDDHVQFLSFVRKCVNQLASKKLIIVTDREFNFSEIFPLGSHIYCWNHLERDLIYYLKSKGNCNSKEISSFVQSFKALMMEKTEKEFDDSWVEMRQKSFFQGNSVVLSYFENKLLPAFKCHASIWILKSAGVENPEAGITNNPSESINAVLHSLQYWKHVPLDIVCLSLFYLSSYYHREIERGIHQMGNWKLKNEYHFMARDSTLMPQLPKVVDPKEIVERVRNGSLSISAPQENNDVHVKRLEIPPLNTANAQLSLAQDIVDRKFVTLADVGCWLVKSVNGETPQAVRLHPKETCTCSQAKGCYHILACKIMSGQDAKDFTLTKPNMSTLQQRIRKKNKEKPSGRKQPRKNDFSVRRNGDSDDEGTTMDNNAKQQRVQDEEDIKVETDKNERAQSDTPVAADGVTSTLNLSRRILHSSNSCSVTWNDFLSNLNDQCPEILLYPQICSIGVHDELKELKKDSIIVLETKKSSHVSFLKRNSDELKVEIISSNRCPDYSELEYYAGSLLHSESHVSFIALYPGVQLSDCDDTDLVLAGLLLLAITKPNIDLARVRMSAPAIIEKIQGIMLNETKSIAMEYEVASGPFCKERVVEVPLYCHCFRPWIDGTSATKLFGKEVKEFNLHQCCQCQNWFHFRCLKGRGIIPKRNADFKCIGCAIPPTIPWHHKMYTNTCTVDNLLSAILLHCKQYPNFISTALGESEPENAIKASLKLMLDGSMIEGKTVMLQFAHSKVNYQRTENGQYDCHGNEYNRFIQLFKDISKVHIKQQCPSTCCPLGQEEIDKIIYSYSFSRPSVSPIKDQLDFTFPKPGYTIKGYCGARFSNVPPPGASYVLSDRLDVDQKTRVDDYVCGGKPIVLSSRFLSLKPPWMIAVCISEFEGVDVNELPAHIKVYGQKYQLRGYSLHTSGHFTAVLTWQNKKYFYDGLKHTKEERLVPMRNDKLHNKTGSFAYYLLLI